MAVGISYAGRIAKSGLGTAMVKNQDGQFLLATPDTIATQPPSSIRARRPMSALASSSPPATTATR